MQTLFLPDAPGRTGKGSLGSSDALLVGELLPKSGRKRGLVRKTRRPQSLSVLVFCSWQKHSPDPFDSAGKALAGKLKRQKRGSYRNKQGPTCLLFNLEVCLRVLISTWA